MTFAFSAAPRTFLASCSRIFSFTLASRSLGVFVAAVTLLMSGSILSAQENGTSSLIAVVHSEAARTSRNPRVRNASRQSSSARTVNFNVFSTAFNGLDLQNFYDFSMDPATGYYYACASYGPGYGSGPISVYLGAAALATNTPSSSVTLSGGFYGTYFAVQNGVLFGRLDQSTSAISSWNAVTGQSISTSAVLNMCGTNSTCTFEWGGFSGVNWMQDSTGLYVLGTDDVNGWQVDLMNTDLSVNNSQLIYPPSNELGYAFAIKGHLLTADWYDVNTIEDDFNVLTGIDQPVSYTLAGLPANFLYLSNTLYDPTIDRLYIWNKVDGILYSADNASQQFGVNSVLDFGPLNVGTAAAVQTFAYQFNNPTTLSAVDILTGGASGLDYSDGGSSTCTAGTAYIAGQRCVVTVAFTPSAPGVRSGAVTIFAQGNPLPLTTFYLSGIGQSSAVTIDLGMQSKIATLSNAGQGYGSAIDDSGNVYVVDHANSQVIKLAAGSFTPTVVVAAGLSGPTAVALDGPGNLYIADTGNGRVETVPNENGTLNSADMSSVGISGLGSPVGLAVDAAGNLYVSDGANGDVVRFPLGGTPVTVASALISPGALAVDANGNVYVTTNNSITEYPFGGGSPITIGSGFANPSGLAVDASGAVYVADTGNARIVRVAAGGSSQTDLLVTGITHPEGVTVDAAGNVLVTDSDNVIRINRTQAAALAFGSTNVGSTSASQTVMVSNSGNQTLNVSNLAIATNFTQMSSGGGDCSSNMQLSSSSQCAIAVAFAPRTSGSLLGTVTLADDALNNAASIQTVQLSGTGTKVTQTITFAELSNQTLGTAPFALSASASSGLATSLSSQTTGTCTVSATTVKLIAAGTCTIQATQSGNATYTAATPVNRSFQISGSGFTLSFNPMTITVPPGQSASITLKITPQGSFDSPISFACEGLPAFASCSFNPATVTPNASTVTSTLTIATQSHTASLTTPLGRRLGSLYAVWLVLPAMILGTGMARPKRRKLVHHFLMFLLVGGCLLQIACGTGNNNIRGGTPAGNYVVTVTGAAGSNQHTATMTLTVQ